MPLDSAFLSELPVTGQRTNWPARANFLAEREKTIRRPLKEPPVGVGVAVAGAESAEAEDETCKRPPSAQRLVAQNVCLSGQSKREICYANQCSIWLPNWPCKRADRLRADISIDFLLPHPLGESSWRNNAEAALFDTRPLSSEQRAASGDQKGKQIESERIHWAANNGNRV